MSKDFTDLTFGERIIAIRKSKGLTQKMLEEAAGIKREYLSKLESGHLLNPTLTTINKLASAFNVCPALLIPTTKEQSIELKKDLERLSLDEQLATAKASIAAITATLRELVVIAESLNILDAEIREGRKND